MHHGVMFEAWMAITMPVIIPLLTLAHFSLQSTFFLRFVYLFSAVMGLCYCLRALSSSGERGLLSAIHVGFPCCGTQAVGTWAQLLRRVAPRHGKSSGIEPESPALAGGFLTTRPLGKCLHSTFKHNVLLGFAAALWCCRHFLHRWRNRGSEESLTHVTWSLRRRSCASTWILWLLAWWL